MSFSYSVVLILASSCLTHLTIAAEVNTVKVEPVTKVDAEDSYNYPVTVESQREALITAPFAAFVRKIQVNLGERVQTGQPLLQLEHQQPEFSLKEHPVKSSIAGEVAEIFVKTGNQVPLAGSLIRIVDPHDLQLVFQMAQKDRPIIKNGMAGEVSFDSHADIKLPVKVEAIGPTLDPATGTSKVLLSWQKDPSSPLLMRLGNELRAGMVGKLKISLQKRSVLAVKNSAVFWQKQGFNVRVVIDSKAVKKKVKIGRDLDGDMKEILSGLEEKEMVIIHSDKYLRDNEQVEINSGK